MKPTAIHVTITLFILGIVGANPTYALNEEAHEVVNEHATRQSQLDQVLKTQLGFREGIEQPVGGRAVFRWLRDGGKQEDSPPCRTARHFHNPLFQADGSGIAPWPGTWTDAGLDVSNLLDIGNALIALGCGALSFSSSIHWAQDPDQTPGTPAAWQAARDQYYLALTASDPGTREQALAETFRILGQQMHLVTDASVPEHVRNDLHLLEGILRQVGLRGYGSYEYWVSDEQRRSESAFVQTYLATPVRPDPVILEEPTGDDLAPVPIAGLIDTDTYDGTDPNVTLGNTVGIAEIAHANFFSEDTGTGQYAFPAVGRLVASQHPAPKTGRVRGYYAKAAGDGIPVDPVLAECLLDQAAVNSGIAPATYVKCTDENVWANVADQMLPRAVGYSAALLDYFFRGKIEATSDVRLNAQGEWRIFIKIVNRTPGETLAGDVEFYDETVDGARVFVASSPLTLLPDGDTELDLDIRSSGDGSPLPSRYLLVFRGMLGVEEGAVATTWVAWRDGAWRIALGANLPGFDGINRVGASIEHQPNFSLFDAAFGASLVIDAFEFKVREEGYPAMLHQLTFMMLYREMTFLPGNTLNFRVLVGGCGNESLGFSDRRQSTGPAMVQLVEFEPPPTWAEFFAYQWPGPPVKRVLAEFTSSDPPGSIDVTGVPLIGLRLIYGLVPDAPPLNLDRSSNSFAYFTESWCQVFVSLTFQ